MDALIDEIKKLASGFFGDIVSVRQHLHAHPELSKEEYETARFISSELDKAGIMHNTGIAGTGIVGYIRGEGGDGMTVALRADMDALPIQEKNEVPYKSQNPGVMHACGHDVHTACLLGAAKIIHRLKDRFKGQVMLIFQPSEERYPGGARMMLEEGIFNTQKPDVIYGMHVYPDLEAGKAGVRPGKYMASTDEIFITIKGKGGHGALPDKLIDPVVIASQVVLALQQIASRNANPNVPTVISFGRFIADGRTNIIPDEVRIEGIMRTFDEAWRAEIKEKIVKIVRSVAEGMGASCEVFIDQGYPFLENDHRVTAGFKKFASAYLGNENLVDLNPRMTAEDFSYYLQQVPGCFYRLGIANSEKGIISGLHTSTFDVDEKSIETGMGLMAWLALNELIMNNELN